MNYIEYTLPNQIVKFYYSHLSDVLNNLDKTKTGKPQSFTLPSLADYIVSFQGTKNVTINSLFQHALMKTCQLLINEGVITPCGPVKGLNTRFNLNEVYPDKIEYGYYDFIILGFPVIREKFIDTIRPVILNQGVLDKTESIGTSFGVKYEKKLFLITARHCLKPNEFIKISRYSPSDQLFSPLKIWTPDKPNIDIAILEVDYTDSLVCHEWLRLGEPAVLDEIMTMGYPPIPGFTEAILISETARVSSHLKSTTGAITGIGQHYLSGGTDHLLISARVKGGNSGGPVINKKGEVIGLITQDLATDNQPDLLGYGVALSSSVLIDTLDSIIGKSDTFKVKELSFNVTEKGFVIRN